MSIVIFPTEEKAYPTEESGIPERRPLFEDNDFNKLSLDVDSLNITSEAIDFDEIDEDLDRFQEDEMVKQALHRGVDLKKYGHDLEKQLKEAESDSIGQYMNNSEQVSELHKQMQDCDAVLARMQEMLQGFQTDLGGISEEIKHLQDESLSMSIRLKNRRAAEDKLHKFLENTTITPELATTVTTGVVNEAYLEAIIELSNKLRYIQQNAPANDGSTLDMAPYETFAGRALLPDLDRLKNKSISKIKEYFTSQFNALRKPKTNVQMLQQTGLIKYSSLIQFLQQEALHVAEDLRNMYIASMDRTLHSLFRSYHEKLMKLEISMASKQDLIAIEEAALRSVFTQKVDLSKRSDAFAMGERDKILDQIESEPILVHVATAESQRFPFEMLLRSEIKHLSDAATNEFLFVLDFFGTSLRDTFNKIFVRTLSLILENLENYLLTCFDAVGLLLMIKVTHYQRMVMQRRRIPVLDPFFDRVSMLLWPRFQFVVDANLKSIKNAVPRKLGPVDTSPHYVSRRYAEFVSSILTLQGGTESLGVGGGGEHMLLQDVQQLRVEVVSLLDRLDETLSTPKEKKVFFINNLDQILSVFQERRIISEEVRQFEDLLTQQRELFAEEELRGSFPRLISFVLQTEHSMSAATGSKEASRSPLSLDEEVVGNLVREFAQSWRQGIQQINDDVMAYFANFRNGMEILKQVLTQLLLYYSRFQDIIKRAWSRPPPFMKDIVSTATMLMEIKRYSRTF